MFLLRLCILVLPLLCIACTPTPMTSTTSQYYPAQRLTSPTPKHASFRPGKMVNIYNKPVEKGNNETAIEQINKRALMQATNGHALNSIIVFPYEAGYLYEIYTTPLNISDLQFRSGEMIISVAAGDTLRWQISKTISGDNNKRIEHLLIKPQVEDLNTTLVVTTTQRTYHLLLKSTVHTFMAIVQWRYENEDFMVGDLNANLADVSFSGNEKFDYSYQSKLVCGERPAWWPVRIFNEGGKTFIQFPPNMQSIPALLIKQDHAGMGVANYRVQGDYYIIDQAISGAELISDNGQTIVEIARQ